MTSSWQKRSIVQPGDSSLKRAYNSRAPWTLSFIRCLACRFGTPPGCAHGKLGALGWRMGLTNSVHDLRYTPCVSYARRRGSPPVVVLIISTLSQGTLGIGANTDRLLAPMNAILYRSPPGHRPAVRLVYLRYQRCSWRCASGHLMTGPADSVFSYTSRRSASGEKPHVFSRK
jgi:hypothetical protein